MQTIEYRTVDKSKWGVGEWTDEPDKKQWQDQATGLPCLIVRGPSGALCGYVGVTKDHPWFAVNYSDDKVQASCHGGLTYSDFCADTKDEANHICHKPEAGEPDHVWWFGFDCAHHMDLCPKYAETDICRSGYYRDLRYVTGEVTRLAEQLARA